MSSKDIYTDITHHNWAQAVESFELIYDFMHILLGIRPLFLNMSQLCLDFLKEFWSFRLKNLS